MKYFLEEAAGDVSKEPRETGWSGRGWRGKQEGEGEGVSRKGVGVGLRRGAGEGGKKEGKGGECRLIMLCPKEVGLLDLGGGEVLLKHQKLHQTTREIEVIFCTPKIVSHIPSHIPSFYTNHKDKTNFKNIS